MDVRKKGHKNKRRKKEEGLAIIEAVPMVFIFITLLSFTLGFYGITQKMILSSIAARAYGFEIMRHRANITYLRDVGEGASDNSYHETKSRYFSTRANDGTDEFVAHKLDVRFPAQSTASAKQDEHNTSAFEDLSRQGLSRKRNTKHLFQPVWVMNGYGICLRSACGQ